MNDHDEFTFYLIDRCRVVLAQGDDVPAGADRAAGPFVRPASLKMLPAPARPGRREIRLGLPAPAPRPRPEGGPAAARESPGEAGHAGDEAPTVQPPARRAAAGPSTRRVAIGSVAAAASAAAIWMIGPDPTDDPAPRGRTSASTPTPGRRRVVVDAPPSPFELKVEAIARPLPPRPADPTPELDHGPEPVATTSVQESPSVPPPRPEAAAIIAETPADGNPGPDTTRPAEFAIETAVVADQPPPAPFDLETLRDAWQTTARIGRQLARAGRIVRGALRRAADDLAVEKMAEARDPHGPESGRAARAPRTLRAGEGAAAGGLNPDRGGRGAVIRVRMPAEDAEMIIGGAVGAGLPEEWVGRTRVIRTPPLAAGVDYLIGAFWTDADGRRLTRTTHSKVGPGDIYEVDLGMFIPAWKHANP